MKISKENLLTILILIALVLGALVGQFFLYDSSATAEKLRQATSAWRTAGDLVLIRPLMLIIIPLIFTSVLTGVTSIGDPKKLGVLGGATLIFYVVTMILAVTTGVTLAWLFNPGAAAASFAASQAESLSAAATSAPPPGGLGAAWLEILYMMVPNNFVAAAANNETLSIITATIALGIALTVVGSKARPFVVAVEALHEALMTLVRWILWVLPLGVFFLVAWAVGNMGFAQLFQSLGMYVFVVLLGLVIHATISLPVVLWLLTRINPFRYLWAMKPALLMAFGSASSLATMPVTIETSVDKGGCSRRAAGLVLPLGATVNMDGTALYQGIAVIFLFQAFGVDLHFTQYLVIVLTATLAAVGAAGVPGGSIATTLIIIAAVNTTLAAIPGVEPLPPSAIGLILGVDRILDMARTTVNVWGDSVGARIITRIAPDDIPHGKEAAYG
ncbi:MAG: dicarboxylate/amino acid:cation symporter [Phycisphaerales bacterium]